MSDAGPALDAFVARDAVAADATTTCENVGWWDQHHVDDAVPSPDGEGWCCQPGLPTCDCAYFGGFVVDRCDCGRQSWVPGRPNVFGPCDLAPPDWVSTVDSHGCMHFVARSPATECCNCLPPDAG